MGIKLLGAGRYLPQKVVNNKDFESLVETSNEWIVKRTGICNRHFSDGEYTVQMGVKAATDALKKAQIEPSELDLIIFSTVTADFSFPSMSNILQGKLKAKNAFAIDISCACSGFLYALDMARRYVDSDDEIKNVLIVCSENMTKLVDFSDRSTCVLFGDGAGAVVVQKNDNKFVSVLKTDGTKSGLIYSNLKHPNNCFAEKAEVEKNRSSFEQVFFPKVDDNFLHMNGSTVYREAIDCMVSSMQQVCCKAKINFSDLAYIIPHQANARIIDRVVQKLGIDPEKVFVNIKDMGNISSACIPVCLSQLFEGGFLKSGDSIGLVSFGSGFIYGAIIWTI